MVLLPVLATNDGMAHREIADAMRISRARVTTIVQALEKAGSVYRVRDENDQRVTRVYLTDLGRALDQENGSLRPDSINRIFGTLAERDRVELQRIFDLVTLGIQRVLQSNGAAELD